jgi:hypothetical protein
VLVLGADRTGQGNGAGTETFAGKRAGQLGHMTNRKSALPPRPGRQRPPRPSPKGLYIVIAAGSILATAGGLVGFFLGSDPVAEWIVLVSALLAATAGISFFASLSSSRRRWQEPGRTELLRAVVTVVSALERRRCEESSLDHD